MRLFLLFTLFMASFSLNSQTHTIKGKLMETNKLPLPYASVILKKAVDSSFVKAELSSEDGGFTFEGIETGKFFIEVELIGFKKTSSRVFDLDQNIVLDELEVASDEQVLGEVTVKAQRALIEIKPDRNIFNVQGTINSAGENGLTLLRKAPGVRLDNNNTVTVLGRTGVLVYVDGKRIPLSGDDLTNYLQSLTSEQIDRIEIITNPGAKYEAQGNAGIIDIRLKKDKNEGGTGSVNFGFGQGRQNQFNVGGSGNFRKGKINVFGNANYTDGALWNKLIFKNYQNGLLLDESNIQISSFKNINTRLGIDYSLNKNSTIGVLVSVLPSRSNSTSDNISKISRQSTLDKIDSVLVAPNTSEATSSQFAYNLNYAYNKNKTSVNFDADYANYNSDPSNNQPNFYYSNVNQSQLLSSRINRYASPSEISILALKLDIESKLKNTTLGYGAKYSKINTDNNFSFFNKIDNEFKFNNRRSNQFIYDEGVMAAYVTLNGKLSKYINFTSGLRMENTDILGTLNVFADDLKVEPFKRDQIQFFPSLGVTYSKNPMHSYSLKFGRRINRPDYKVLNPFREQLSELSFAKGNQTLNPEIVNNAELSYTLKYMYNFNLSYSQISNQITRLIGPDDSDARASFISWDNLASQKLLSLNASIPHQFNKWWSAYFNAGVSYIDNQADYGSNGKVDVQVVTYNVYQQQTFTLPKGFKGEFSGWYSGPGVWGGVFLYEALYSLDLGLSKKILKDKMNIRLSASDIFFSSGWKGVSQFNGLRGEGRGNYDSRRVNLAISYDFGNFNVKSRKRTTSSESELKRIQN